MRERKHRQKYLLQKYLNKRKHSNRKTFVLPLNKIIFIYMLNLKSFSIEQRVYEKDISFKFSM